MTETFHGPPAVREAQRDVAEFRRFQKMAEKLITINKKICKLRPVEDRGWSEWVIVASLRCETIVTYDTSFDGTLHG